MTAKITKTDVLRMKAAVLTREACEASAVEGDRRLVIGDPIGASLAMEAVLGLRIAKTPCESGYHPMMALMMLLERAESARHSH